jgi:hypothetical protein
MTRARATAVLEALLGAERVTKTYIPADKTHSWTLT